MLRGSAMVLILSFMWPFGGGKEWRDAEKVWRAGMEAEGNPQKSAVKEELLPYAFLTRAGTDNVYRIVHQGHLLPRGGGVAALATYLRDIDAFHRDKLKAGDYVELLKTFEARPPADNPSFASDSGLEPALRRSTARIELVVHAFVPDHTRPGVTMPSPPEEQEVERWTLTVDRQHGAWSKETIKVKRTPKTTL
jgi:hypothetical protein